MAKVYGFVGKFGSAGSGNGQFSFTAGSGNTARACGIAVNASYIYVLDAGNSRVQVFNNSSPYAYVGQFGSAGTGSGQFTQPDSLAIDSTHIYVNESGLGRVQKFDISSYAFVSSFTSGILVDLVGMAVDTNFIYYFESSAYLVYWKSSFLLQYAGSLSGLGAGQRVSDCAVNSTETAIYIVSAYAAFLFKPGRAIVASGVPITQTEFGVGIRSQGIAVDTNYIYVAGYDSNRITAYDISTLANTDYFGATGTADGYFDGIGKIRVYNNKLYVVDTGNSRVQIFDWSDKVAPAAPSGLTLSCAAGKKILVGWTDNS